MKKLFLLLLTLCLSSIYAGVTTIDQSTKAKATETFLTACKNKDTETVWQLLAPDTRKSLVQKTKDLKKAKEAIANHFAFPERQNARDKWLGVMLDTCITVFLDNHGVQIKGKWYFDFNKTRFVEAKGQEILNRKYVIDQSSRQKLAGSYFNALMRQDANGMWQLLAPAMQKIYISRAKSVDEAKKTALKLATNKLGKDMFLLFALVSESPEHWNVLTNTCFEPLTAFLVQIDGKWYLDGSKYIKDSQK